MGKSLHFAIDKLNLDTSQFFTFDEPPGILRGVNIQLGDTCEIELYVDRTSIINHRDSLGFKQLYVHIINKEVIGVSWKKTKLNKQKTLFLNPK